MENIGRWEKYIDKFTDAMLSVGLRIVAAVLLYCIGKYLIGRLVKIIKKTRGFKRLDTTAAGYIVNFIKAVLYVVLGVSIVAIMGVPMSSIIAVIASAGVAIGMAMQGALSNIAGGIMLLIFRPFNVGDYIISSTGEKGYVQSISLVYTVLRTYDNRIVSVPNGGLMNASISNETAEELRRVDLNFNISNDADVNKVQDTIMSVIRATENALDNPEPQVVPTAAIPGGLIYAVRVWTETKNYWPVCDELMRSLPMALNEAGISGAATPVTIDNR